MMKTKITFFALILLSGCITINKNVINPAPAEAKATNINHYTYSKVFFASGEKWYKIATIKSKGNIGKHICAFDIYSYVSPHTGVYYGSFFLNLRRGAEQLYGHFYCTDWNKDEVSNFSPKDLCVTYNGTYNEEVTTIIWKKASSYEDFWYFGAKFVAEAVIFTFAENNYRGNQEYITKKPSTADGYDFVIDVENTSNKEFFTTSTSKAGK